jgi:lysozyme
MTPEDQTKLHSQLKIDEGCRLYVYPDSLGFLTIGYGRLVDRKKGGQISQEEAEYLLNNDIAAKEKDLAPYSWFAGLDSVRQSAVVNMCFNLGIQGLLHFPHFLGYLQVKDFPNAVLQIKDTPWHAEVGVRGDRIIAMIEKGVWA